MYQISKKNNVEQFMVCFCQDALSELKTYDRKLRNKFIIGEKTGNTGGFYNDYPKGLSIYSITEPIIKWLIYTNLCDRYCMRTEFLTSYGKYLDLALSLKPNNDVLDIAIEMKWAGFRKKDGKLYENSRLNMIDDAIKLYKMDFSYKYLMQFAILNTDEYKKIDFEATVEGFDGIDKRKFRNSQLNPEPIFMNSFPTWDENKNTRRFTMLVWEINKK